MIVLEAKENLDSNIKILN